MNHVSRFAKFRKDQSGQFAIMFAIILLPLLAKVNNPIAVDPDATLRKHAEQYGWRILTLR